MKFNTIAFIVTTIFFIYQLPCGYCQIKDPFIDSLLIEAGKEKKWSRLARIYNDIGFHYHDVHDEVDEAEVYAFKGLKIGKDQGLDKACGDAYNVLGLTSYTRMENQLAIMYYDSATYYFNIIKDTSGLIAVYNNIGRVYTSMGNCEKAMEGFLKGIKLTESQNQKFKLVHLKVNYALGLLDCFQYNDAIEVAESTLPMGYEVNAKIFPPPLYYVIASSHGYLGNYSLAVEKLWQVADTILMNGDTLNYGNTLGELGSMYLKMKQYESALNVLNKSIEINARYDAKINDAGLQVDLGRALIGIGDITEGLQLLESGIQLAEEKKDINHLSEAYFQLAEVYQDLGDYELANEAVFRSKILGDSLRSLKIQGRVRELVKKYEVEKMERKIVETELANHYQKNRFLLLLGAILLLFIALGLLYYFRLQKIKRNALELDRRKIQLEYNILRAQMNPHFIFNALNSIQGFFSNNQFTQGNEYLSTFSQLIRQILNHTGQSLISLEAELDTLEAYLQLEQLRLKSQLSYKIDLQESIDPSFYDIPPMILQPFVENAIWHGIVPKKEPGHIDVKVFENKESDYLIVEIEDDGIGIRNKQFENAAYSDSKGISITKDRLAPKGDLSIETLYDGTQPSGTLVTIKIPKVYD